MIGLFDRQGLAATLKQHCPQMTQRRCKEYILRLILLNSSVTEGSTLLKAIVSACASSVRGMVWYVVREASESLSLSLTFYGVKCNIYDGCQARLGTIHTWRPHLQRHWGGTRNKWGRDRGRGYSLASFFFRISSSPKLDRTTRNVSSLP